MEGVRRPSRKRVSLSIFAYGSLGLGSLGVPSTRAQRPMVLSQPTMLFSTHVWMMDSRTRTPAPIITPFPMETLGMLTTALASTVAVGWM
uniref:Uncharacterized protein n=1 Tax=Anolis carolinensis TaxID=28377 RepID=H9G615_ANOCA